MESQGSRIRWRNQDIYTEKGVGYEKFTAESVITYTEDDNLVVEIKPVVQLSEYKKPETINIIEISYSVYLASNELELRQSINCNDGKAIKWEKSVKSIK